MRPAGSAGRRRALDGDDLRTAGLRLPLEGGARAPRPDGVPGGHRGGRDAGAPGLFAGQGPGGRGHSHGGRRSRRSFTARPGSCCPTTPPPESPCPLSRPYESGPPRPGEALITPPSTARSPMVRSVRKKRVIYLSGWALREASRAEFDADVLIPMSDHADFADAAPPRGRRLAAARRRAPRLRARLRPHPRQRRHPGGALAGPRGAGARGAVTAYREIADALEAVAASRGRLAKVARLAQTLARVEPEELPAAARLLSGSPFAEHEEAVTSVGWATVLRAASAVTGWDEETVRACAGAIGDLGEAVGLLRPAEGPERDDDRGDRRVLSRARAAAQERREAGGARGDAPARVGGRGEVSAQDALRRSSDRRRRHDGGGGDRRGLFLRSRGRGQGPARQRRRRRDGGGRARGPARGDPLPPLSPHRLHARLADRVGGGGRRGAAVVRGGRQVRRHPGPRAQGRRTGRALLANPGRRDRAVSGGRPGALGPFGEFPAGRRDRGVAGGPARVVLPPPAAPGTEGARGDAPGRDPGGVHRLRLPGGGRRAALRTGLGRARARGWRRSPRGPLCASRRRFPRRARRRSRRSSTRRAPVATRAWC